MNPDAISQDSLQNNTLKQRFLSVWKDCLEPGANTQPLEIWNLIEHHYSGPGRHYHTLNHLHHCMNQMNLAAAAIEAPKALELAILFHDVICEPNTKDNEQRSADLFEQTARNNFSPDFINRVKNLIISTAHNKIPPDNDGKLICDIDLSSFAIPWEHFLKDSNAVRAEHASTPDQLFYPAKLKFLNMMLERPAIFLTDLFYQRDEKAARANIQRYMQHLENQFVAEIDLTEQMKSLL